MKTLLALSAFALFCVSVPTTAAAKSIGPPDCITGCAIGGAVPEPMTWALMICGLGLAGAKLRVERRRGVV